jgi:hypothetical protein
LKKCSFGRKQRRNRGFSDTLEGKENLPVAAALQK